MQKIVPHLWYDKEAKEAAEFYVSVFAKDSKVTNIVTLHNTSSGDCDVVSFQLWGYSFMAISAGPFFTFNPSISFMVNFDTSQDKEAKTHIDEVWNKLVEGGKILMPLDACCLSVMCAGKRKKRLTFILLSSRTRNAVP